MALQSFDHLFPPPERCGDQRTGLTSGLHENIETTEISSSTPENYITRQKYANNHSKRKLSHIP